VCPPHRLVFVDRVVGVTSTPHLFQFESPQKKKHPMISPLSSSGSRTARVMSSLLASCVMAAIAVIAVVAG
jgi:hypothetical protein